MGFDWKKTLYISIERIWVITLCFVLSTATCLVLIVKEVLPGDRAENILYWGGSGFLIGTILAIILPISTELEKRLAEREKMKELITQPPPEIDKSTLPNKFISEGEYPEYKLWWCIAEIVACLMLSLPFLIGMYFLLFKAENQSIPGAIVCLLIALAAFPNLKKILKKREERAGKVTLFENSIIIEGPAWKKHIYFVIDSHIIDVDRAGTLSFNDFEGNLLGKVYYGVSNYDDIAKHLKLKSPF